MAALTRSSNEGRPFSWGALLSVLLGIGAVLMLPAAILFAERGDRITLLQAAVAIAPAAILALAAVFTGRRSRRTIERTLGRVRGYKLAAFGRILGYFALYMVLTACIAVATYYVLRQIA